nr:hypothetical protein [uncultured Caproiciproducens sp.]
MFDSDSVQEYHIYQSFFSPDSIRSELGESGFHVEAVLSNLSGEKYSPASLEIGIVCTKA